MFRSKRVCRAAVVLACALVAAGCQSRDQSAPPAPARGEAAASAGGAAQQRSTPQPPPEGKRGGTLSIALQRDLGLLNPFVETSSTNQAIREQAYESLLALDQAGNPQPHLAERWEVSPDGRVYTFHLRRGVKFHDGQELVAEDLKWGFDYVMNPGNGAFGHPNLENVQQVEAIGSHTLRVTLKAGSPAFLSVLTDIQTILAVPRESVPEGVVKPTSAPPGTGPFKLVQWEPRQRVVFERFDDYWGQKAYLDRVILRPIADATVRFTALRAGDVDVAERTPNQWVREILDGKLTGLGIVEASSSGLRSVKFNVTDPPFDNLKLRQAVAHAIDKQEYLQAVYFGLGRPIDQLYPEGHAWHVAGLPWPKYDLDRARQLLQEAGYSGQEILIIAEPGVQEIEATAIQAQLRKIGLNLRLDIVEAATKRDRDRRGEFALQPSGNIFNADPSATYGPEFMCPPDLRRRGDNSAGYCDKEVDALIEQLETELDQQKRKDIVRQILTRVAQDIPDVFIASAPRYFTFRDYVKAFPVELNGRWMPYQAGLNYTWLDK
jgi:peptide/nickel transport system substrate-binding protein